MAYSSQLQFKSCKLITGLIKVQFECSIPLMLRVISMNFFLVQCSMLVLLGDSKTQQSPLFADRDGWAIDNVVQNIPKESRSNRLCSGVWQPIS
jgi:hypothetical protein